MLPLVLVRNFQSCFKAVEGLLLKDHSCRGATQIFQNIQIVRDLLVIPMCEVKSAHIDIIEDFK
jgi:hypothetical protein